MSESKVTNIKDMAIGDQIRLQEDEVTEVKYLRTLETKPKKNLDKTGNPILPVPYAQMRYGSTSFTINTAEDVVIVENPDSRDDIYSMTLEVTEFDEPAIDSEGNPVLDPKTQEPMMNKRRGLAFVSLQTYTSRQARAMKQVSLQGAVHAEKVKFGLVEEKVSKTELAKELYALMNAGAAPVAAVVAQGATT